ncbi:MAG TPA: isochorismate synthase [Kofleriaceae bacterium]|jgi:menaquinone-specific isochorismate synthase|nr:isochorismate synthase [Kofleriaceae bacterium]
MLDAAISTDTSAPDIARMLDAGLATARATRGLTFVVLPAPVVAPAAIIAAWRGAPIAAWSARELQLVGIGVARELRGRGASRFDDIVDQARAIEIGTITDSFTPRLLGGAAFTPGAADAAPWCGFGDAWFALPRWTYSSGQLVLAVDANDARHAGRWHDELAAFHGAFAARYTPRPQPPMLALDPGDVDAWRAEIRAITTAIGGGDYAKIVAARKALVALAGEARVADVLAELDARHGDCVRVVMRPPNANGATLVAATPERLVELRGGTRVSCDALAGSLPRDLAADVLLASDKDRREHRLVVDAITSALAGFGARVDAPDEPGLRALRHVWHLHTPISATLPAPRHVLELVAALHPTPAVGGTPTRAATEWIAAHEPARGWYASPVGWFDLDGNGELAVAIRSGVIAGDRAHLWAGAGIVAGSDPDRELAETDVKLRAMLGALGVAT